MQMWEYVQLYWEFPEGDRAVIFTHHDAWHFSERRKTIFQPKPPNMPTFFEVLRRLGEEGRELVNSTDWSSQAMSGDRLSFKRPLLENGQPAPMRPWEKE